MTTLKHTYPAAVVKKNGGSATMFNSQKTSSSNTEQDKEINVSSPIIIQASSQAKSPVQLRTFSKKLVFIDKSYEKNGKIEPHVTPQSQPPRFLHEPFNRTQIPPNPTAFARNISESSQELQAQSDPLQLEGYSYIDMSKRGFTNDHTYSTSKCIECEFCHQNFENLEQLMSHFVSDHSSKTKSFICVLCDRTFVSTVLLKKHMDLHKDSESHEIFCDICEDRFKTDDDLHRHLDSHTVIRSVFSSMKSFHSLKCLFCRTRSNTRRAFFYLRQHELKKHRSELNFVCNVGNCKEPFSHLYLLEAHKICHLADSTKVNQETTTATMTMTTTYPCLVCNYQFDTVKALKYHHLIHLDFLERSSRLNYKRTLEMELFCKKCGKAFIQREDVKLHTKSCLHSTSLRCELCPEYYFTERSHLVNHIIEKHETKSTPNNKMYRCFKPNCAKWFVTDFMYKRHLRYHHLSRCPLCEFGIKISKYLQEDIKSKIKSHMTSSHIAVEDENSKCKVCLKGFCTPLASIVHLRKRHPEIFSFICTICDKTYSAQEQLNAHTLSHNTNVFTDAEGRAQDYQMFECYCSSSFISVDAFQDHLESHTGEGLLICELCVSHNRLAPSLFHGIENLQKHIEREHSSAETGTVKGTPWESIDFDALIEEHFPRKICSSSSPPTTISTALSASPSSSSQNKEDVIMMDTENDVDVADNAILPSRSAKCQVCDKILRHSTALRLHQHTHPELFIYKCPEANCDSKFVSEIHLFTHAQIHSYIPDEPLVCYCCSNSRTFETKEDLVKHLQGHTQDKKKTCPHCHKVLYSRKHLADHIASVHDTTLFRCTECIPNVNFASKQNLIRHQSSRHSTSNETFDCTECPKKYRSKAMLYCHRREVHNPVMQQCDQCGEMVVNCKFKMHLFKVHGVDTFNHTRGRALRRYRCYFCSQQFTSLVHLELHMTSHTKERNTILIKTPPEKGQRTRNPPSRLIDCKICGKQFQRIYTYNMHMNFHNGVRKIKCSVCSKTFSNYLSRAGHQLSHRTLNPQEINKNKETKAFAKTWTSFTCKFCRKVFTVRTQYQYHLNQHTGKTPYKCHICGMRFSHSGHFLGHRKKHLMWGDYKKRPDNMRGALPESDDDAIAKDDDKVARPDPLVDEATNNDNVTDPAIRYENPFPTFSFQEMI